MVYWGNAVYPGDSRIDAEFLTGTGTQNLNVRCIGRLVAGPMGAEEGILYAECNLELGINMKLRHDFAGHYNRPDIFQLHINRTAPRIYTAYGGNDAPAPGTPDAMSPLPDAASRARENTHESLIEERSAEKLPGTADLQHVKRK